MQMKYTKLNLREYYLKKRKALSEESHEELSFAIANQCLNLPIWKLQYFHLFLPIPIKAEVNSTLLLTLLQGDIITSSLATIKGLM